MAEQSPGMDDPRIDPALVMSLVAHQFPRWAHLPVSAVEPGGWDNRTFRLGEDMLVRLPSAQRYASQVATEHAWLPRLAAQLPLPIPQPLALGAPAAGYPWQWSVYRWLPGECARLDRIASLEQLAGDLALFLRTLQAIDPAGGPTPGQRNFQRGGPLATYDPETRRATQQLAGRIDGDMVLAIWDQALASSWEGAPVWLHGDVSAGNLLVADGKLSAVIDFGNMAVGDPACDLAIAWTMLDPPSRAVFRRDLAVDQATWDRGRGWALWKVLIQLAGDNGHAPEQRREQQRVLAEVLSE